MIHRVYLVPGFFGFTNLGDVTYFGHVRRHLAARFGNEGVVHEVHTRPTASLPWRMERLAETIQQTAGPHDRIHLVGHSSGGLDSRLYAVAHPNAARVHSIVTVATPHRGTPCANFFSTLYGKQLLRLLSLATVYTINYGRLPLWLALKMGELFSKVNDRITGVPQRQLLDELYKGLLGQFHQDRRHAIRDFFAEVGDDQSLVNQLTPEAMEVFNATAKDRPGIRYASVVCEAEPPSLRKTLSAGLRPSSQAGNAVYMGLYNLASKGEDGANDVIVPVSSQPWGEVLRKVRADHHDVIGHYDDPTADPPHFDWLPSGSGFHANHFHAVWTDVADFLLSVR